ncbi:hypothetical protein HMPREF1991_02967 [Hoylesella loescheii DSM 19665 = JCM 12249 = ATCC 15930]|uniref:Uncharacterized protein n=1 Tax=Hoylesella loescheii DSM 19665 = JCM 12249 = ATCC 15930 TaxID=1122985 RepID=A0A069QDG8_HOYLO|nr:hypothetical protein HMPREF1991_02967 [Hoylesella loescheii DSM 19665 = JCM 12249 = ATCC 15930]
MFVATLQKACSETYYEKHDVISFSCVTHFARKQPISPYKLNNENIPTAMPLCRC